MCLGRVLLIDSDPGSEHCGDLKKFLSLRGVFKVMAVRAVRPDGRMELRRKVEQVRPRLIFLFLSGAALPGWRDFLEAMRSRPRRSPVLAVMQPEDSRQVMDLLSWGASDFIVPPFKAVDVLARMERFLEPEQTDSQAESVLEDKLGQQLLGESPCFVEVLRKIPPAARSEASVLISGETGTGKELFARALHYCSRRQGKPFIPVNCGAIPLELAENELFGHARMAFTGAVSGAGGLIQEAEGGTLFMDEVDSLQPAAQVKLLRLLQEKEYRPLGSPRLRQADVRMVAATQMEPLKAVQSGKLRRDLYYRLSAIPLELPPLRRRRRDIPLLARHFLELSCRRYQKPPMDLSADALQALCLYDWPGNVRELEHVIERAVVFSREKVLCSAELGIPQNAPQDDAEPFQQAKARYVSHFEQTYLEGLLTTCQGNVTRAARMSGKHRRALYELIRKHGIDVEAFR